MKQSGIYAIVHIESGRRYIGSSIAINDRWCAHRGDLRRGRHKNFSLQTVWAREGADAFRFDVLELVDDRMQLHVREQAHLDQHHPNVFNFSPAVLAPWMGRKRGPMPAEWRARISAANVGRPKPPFTQAHRENMGAARRGKPSPYTPIQREKIIASNKRRTGERHTEEARRKMSMALKGRPGPVISEAGKAHLRELGLKRTYSAETRLKMSESAMRRWSRPAEVTS